MSMELAGEGELVTTEAQLRLDIIHMHDQVIGQARTTLERALECGRLIHQLCLELDVQLTIWWAANDMPFSAGTAAIYRRLWVRRQHIAGAESIKEAERLVRKLPLVASRGRYAQIAPDVQKEARRLLSVGSTKYQVSKKLGISTHSVYVIADPEGAREYNRRYQRERSRKQRQALAEKRLVEREGKRALAAMALQNDPDLSKAYGYLRQALAIIDAARTRAKDQRREHLTSAYGNLTSAEAALVQANRVSP